MSSTEDVHPVTGSPVLPTAPRILGVTGDLADDAVWRRFSAQHLAAQTLSLQRQEWYLKSVRTAVLVLAALAVLGVILGLVFGIVAMNSDDLSSGY